MRLREAMAREHERQNALGELWGKRYDDPLGVGPDFVEIVEYEGMFAVGQRYLKLEIALHVHLMIRPRWGDGDPCNVCVWSVGLSSSAESESKDDAIGRNRYSGDLLRQGERRLRGREYGVRDTVLVTIRQPSEANEGVVVRVPVASFKGLERLDDLYVVGSQSREVPRHGSVAPPFWLRGDRECSPLGNGGMPMLHEAGDEIVESGAEMVGDLANGDLPLQRGLTLDVEDVLRCVRFEASENAAPCVIEKDAPFLVERGKVFVYSLEPPCDGVQHPSHALTSP
jgi:hypothetical protein